MLEDETNQDCEETCSEDCSVGYAAPASTSIFESPEYLKMQARSAALAHAIDFGKSVMSSPDDIVKNAETFADFLLG